MVRIRIRRCTWRLSLRMRSWWSCFWNTGQSACQKYRNETPLLVVRGEWSSELEGVYKFIGGLTKREFDIERIKRERLRVREILLVIKG